MEIEMPQKLGELSSTADPKAMLCDICNDSMYFCDDAEDVSIRS